MQFHKAPKEEKETETQLDGICYNYTQPIKTLISSAPPRFQLKAQLKEPSRHFTQKPY
jgi:hypothetical protein